MVVRSLAARTATEGERLAVQTETCLVVPDAGWLESRHECTFRIRLFRSNRVRHCPRGAYCLVRSLRAGRWPTVLVTITGCEIEDNADADGTTYRVAVTHTYEVNGRQYRGNRTAFGYCGSNWRSKHAGVHELLSTACCAAVRYNPSNAADAVLTYGFNMPIVRILVFGVMWLLLSAFFTTLWTSATPFLLLPLAVGCVRVLLAGAATLWILSRRAGTGILDRIEIR
jgi:hypothetical protein